MGLAAARHRVLARAGWDVEEHGLTVEWLLETHAHADHLSAAQYLKSELGGRIAVGATTNATSQAVIGVRSSHAFNVARGAPPVAPPAPDGPTGLHERVFTVG